MRPKRNESPKFNEEFRKSSKPSGLYKYDIEGEIGEDGSPLKDKFSEYRPVDRKANKYFTLDQEEEEGGRRREKVSVLAEFQKSRERDYGGSRFQERQLPVNNNNNNSRSRMENRERSGSRQGGRSGVKDTREFVRGLEEEEKMKRLDLDKIYRQAGLLRKK